MKIEIDEVLGAIICVGLICAWCAMLWALILGA
jgi:hypothetical protein